MNKIINISNKEGQLVVTSRQIAEDFEKQHKDVLETIRNLTAENSAVKNIMIESSYDSRGKQYPEYLLTRDGFSLLVMGFTGPKALSWKLKYIEAFNKMEESLKESKPQTIEDLIIMQAQSIKNLKQQVTEANSMALKANEKVEETKQEVQAIREAVTLEPNQWRKDTANLINKIATKLGGFEHIKPIRDEAYNLLNNTYGVKLKTRLDNKRKNMALEGCSKSKIDKVNYLDVIAEDKKLINGYINIIGRLAVKYGIA